MPLPHPLSHLWPVALTLLAACATTTAETTRTARAAEIERGRYLVTIGACRDCHTPKVMTPADPVLDSTRLLSGHPAGTTVSPTPIEVLTQSNWRVATNGHLTAYTGPWGVSFTANLTPDRTGLAGWSPEVFIRKIREGKHAGVGRALLPPMPWQMYAHMTDDGLRAVFAYMQSLPPISNAVPAPIPPAGPGVS